MQLAVRYELEPLCHSDKVTVSLAAKGHLCEDRDAGGCERIRDIVCAGVVDQHMQRALLGPEGVRERADAVHIGQVQSRAKLDRRMRVLLPAGQA